MMFGSATWSRGILAVACALALCPASGAAGPEAAGEIFGMPVSMDNYLFAKQAVYTYGAPWGGADLPDDAAREALVWEQLILNYEAFRRGIEATESEVEDMANQFLKAQQQSFTRAGDPVAYRRWISETFQRGDPMLFENQLRYLIQIRNLKDRVRDTQPAAVTDEELRQEFLNESNHVGGEMVVFDAKEEAQAFYEQVGSPNAWEAMKAKGERQVRPVSLMTLEAYIDLWSIPKDQIYAFHALEIGQVGPPMPFGRQWCVYRLLDKRTGNLEEFPPKRDQYVQQLEGRKKYEGLRQWVEQLKQSARLKVLVKPQGPGSPTPAS